MAVTMFLINVLGILFALLCIVGFCYITSFILQAMFTHATAWRGDVLLLLENGEKIAPQVYKKEFREYEWAISHDQKIAGILIKKIRWFNKITIDIHLFWSVIATSDHPILYKRLDWEQQETADGLLMKPLGIPTDGTPRLLEVVISYPFTHRKYNVYIRYPWQGSSLWSNELQHTS